MSFADFLIYLFYFLVCVCVCVIYKRVYKLVFFNLKKQSVNEIKFSSSSSILNNISLMHFFIKNF